MQDLKESSLVTRSYFILLIMSSRVLTLENGLRLINTRSTLIQHDVVVVRSCHF